MVAANVDAMMFSRLGQQLYDDNQPQHVAQITISPTASIIFTYEVMKPNSCTSYPALT